MNIFVLDDNPITAAKQHCDKHVVKMIIESAQMLSTAHRMLDGKETRRPSNSGKRIVQYWEMDSESMEKSLYKAVHMKHPCTIWTMESSANYRWHWKLFNQLCEEYTHRYKKVHETDIKLRRILWSFPNTIPHGFMTPFRQAMFEDCKMSDTVKAYRKFYHKKPFKMVWTRRDTPSWYSYK